jgi:branched-chain amino acid transport system permease protein
VKRALFPSAQNIALIVLLFVGILVPVIISNPFYLHLIIISFIWSILASSLNICMGYTGLVSLAQGSFFGIGAYGVSLMMLKGGMSYWLAVLLSLGLVVLISVLIGLVALRTRGPYFVIFSLCVCLVITTIIHHWDSLTEGARGLTSIPPINPIIIPGLMTLTFTSTISQYYLFLTFLLFTLFVVNRIIHSRLGRAFQAVRLNETLADSLGINVMATKMFSFALSAFFAGLAGVLYPPYISYLNPADSSFWVSFNAILYVIVGGAGTLGGPVIGVFLMTIIPELLRFLAEYRLLFYALVLILTVIFFPTGLIGLPRLMRRETTNVNKRRAGTYSG